jgi:Flp pilus assembly protein TadG
MRGKGLLFAGRFQQETVGSSSVEFALVVPLLFLVTFCLLDFSRVMYTQMTLQHAVQQAGRFAITGNHLVTATNRLEAIQQVAQQAAMGLDVSSIQISSNNGGGFTTGTAGGPGDIVRISLTCNIEPITPFVRQFFSTNGYVCRVSTTFKNEPFPKSQSE